LRSADDGHDLQDLLRQFVIAGHLGPPTASAGEIILVPSRQTVSAASNRTTVPRPGSLWTGRHTSPS
jgi:hypothetical protein